MNRIEFMRQLEVLLSGITKDDQVDALQYYNDYFDEAGTENESDVIQELGSPEKVAKIIRESLGQDGENNSEYSERGYSDTRFEEKDELLSKNREKNKIPILLLILGVLFIGIPVVLPLGLSGISVVFAIIVTILSLIFAVLIAGVALVVSGVAIIIYGLINVAASVAQSFIVIGTGLLLIVFGALVSYAGYGVMRWSVNLIKKGILSIKGKILSRKVV